VPENRLYHMNVRIILIAKILLDVSSPLMSAALINKIFKPRTVTNFETNQISTTESLLKCNNYIGYDEI
jgi:DNA polymerase III psi subunit